MAIDYVALLGVSQTNSISYAVTQIVTLPAVTVTDDLSFTAIENSPITLPEITSDITQSAVTYTDNLSFTAIQTDLVTFPASTITSLETNTITPATVTITNDITLPPVTPYINAVVSKSISITSILIATMITGLICNLVGGLTTHLVSSSGSRRPSSKRIIRLYFQLWN
jgi:hypothetical protein